MDNGHLVLSLHHSPVFLTPVVSFSLLSQCHCCKPYEACRIPQILQLIKDLKSQAIWPPHFTDPLRPRIRGCWTKDTYTLLFVSGTTRIYSHPVCPISRAHLSRSLPRIRLVLNTALFKFCLCVHSSQNASLYCFVIPSICFTYVFGNDASCFFTVSIEKYIGFVPYGYERSKARSRSASGSICS